MAGYARYTVVLDACVLYPAPLRDLLLSLAAEELITTYEQQGLPQLCAVLREASALI